MATCSEVASATLSALHSPLDFPEPHSAIVPGDDVAIGIDPNTPQVAEITRAVVQYFRDSEAADLSFVIGDEARPSTIEAIRNAVGDAGRIHLHDPSDRESLRYLGADALGNPIYLSRLLVDAGFVLPITTGRWGDFDKQHDLHGIFPAFTDSASRFRFQHPSDREAATCDPLEPAWLLGTQLVLCATSTSEGLVSDVTVGTADSVRKQLLQSQPSSAPGSSAPLVIASLDGDGQQQTWQNAARAVLAAANRVESGGTLVLWTDIDATATDPLTALSDPAFQQQAVPETPSEGDFPRWDPTFTPMATFRRLSADHRILLHSGLACDVVEAIGLGPLESSQELTNLTRSFASCEILRAAAFSGPTYDPYASAREISS